MTTTRVSSTGSDLKPDLIQNESEMSAAGVAHRGLTRRTVIVAGGAATLWFTSTAAPIGVFGPTPVFARGETIDDIFRRLLAKMESAAPNLAANKVKEQYVNLVKNPTLKQLDQHFIDPFRRQEIVDRLDLGREAFGNITRTFVTNVLDGSRVDLALRASVEAQKVLSLPTRLASPPKPPQFDFGIPRPSTTQSLYGIYERNVDPKALGISWPLVEMKATTANGYNAKAALSVEGRGFFDDNWHIVNPRAWSAKAAFDFERARPNHLQFRAEFSGGSDGVNALLSFTVKF